MVVRKLIEQIWLHTLPFAKWAFARPLQEEAEEDVKDYEEKLANLDRRIREEQPQVPESGRRRLHKSTPPAAAAAADVVASEEPVEELIEDEEDEQPQQQSE